MWFKTRAPVFFLYVKRMCACNILAIRPKTFNFRRGICRKKHKWHLCKTFLKNIFWKIFGIICILQDAGGEVRRSQGATMRYCSPLPTYLHCRVQWGKTSTIRITQNNWLRKYSAKGLHKQKRVHMLADALRNISSVLARDNCWVWAFSSKVDHVVLCSCN